MTAHKRKSQRGSKSGDAFTITRVFDAPRDAVWKAWSDPAQLATWWGPKGCRIEISKLEFRPGGFFHYAMRFPDASAMWGRFLYRVIDEPGRIVWLNSFSNPGCGITRAPFDEKIPLEILNDVSFAAVDGGTALTLTATPHGADAEECAAFAALSASMNEGYGGTLDQLAAALAAR
ncbi:MAG: SRPBCC family protein [Hyphomicrobium sp.]